MFCKYCGSKIPENAKFCQNCGGKLDVNLSAQMSNNNAVLTPNNNSTSMNNIPMTNSTSKSNNTILLIFLIIVGICAIVVPIIFMGNDSLKETENKSNEETNIKNEEDKNEPEIEYPKDTTNVQYGGYTFEIPTEYTNMEYDGNLAVLPSDGSWIIMFVFSDANFNELKTQISLLDSMLSEQYPNASSEYKTYQGYEYILTNFTSDGKEMKMVLTDVGNDKLLMSLLMPMDTSVTFDDLFSIAFPIIINVK